MIRTVIQCEHCREQKDLPEDRLRRTATAPGWFTVSTEIDDPTLVHHFCSTGCLILWARGSKPNKALSTSQNYAISVLQNHILAHAEAETSLFHQKYPELIASCSITIDGQRREGEVCCNEAQSRRP